MTATREQRRRKREREKAAKAAIRESGPLYQWYCNQVAAQQKIRNATERDGSAPVAGFW